MKFPPVNPRFPHFLHGGDYNPEQWPEEIWHEDMRLMKLSKCNTMSTAIFAWSTLEPEEGRFEFGWLDRVMDLLAENGAYACLATPSAARPAWMAHKYPEVIRMDEKGFRLHHGFRLGFCITSPIYREKCRIITRKLAERYKNHPALLVWHVNNEIRGQCFCNHCENRFRDWLRERYGSLENLNHRWRTAFWSHTYTDWSQVEAPRGRQVGEFSIESLILDWRRFCNDMVLEMVTNEATILREVTPDVPQTVNEGDMFAMLDVRPFAEVCDVLSWDNYPQYHDLDENWKIACLISFKGDYWRAAKNGKPFLVMESTPSATNMNKNMKLKRPNVHLQSSLQPVAHGADSILYFQWRQTQGGMEKLHGGVVAHSGHEHTRVFKEVTEVGEALAKLDAVIGTSIQPEVAIVYDRQNDWAINICNGPRAEKKDYRPTCVEHYRQFWQRSIPVDVVDQMHDLSKYKLVIAPMTYMIRPGFAERVEAFVKNGGTFVSTYWSGIVDECDICFFGGFPGPLRKCLGIWSEEIDVLYDKESNSIVPSSANDLALNGSYEAKIFCDLIHAEDAEVLASYGKEFYAGRPALTRNRFGSGEAYYMASRNDDRFMSDFYGALAKRLNLRRVLETELPEGTTAQMRTDGENEFVFVFNYKRDPADVAIGDSFQNILTGQAAEAVLHLKGYDSAVLVRKAK